MKLTPEQKEAAYRQMPQHRGVNSGGKTPTGEAKSPKNGGKEL